MKLYYMGGGKGGVGKSTVTFALANYFEQENEPFIVGRNRYDKPGCLHDVR